MHSECQSDYCHYWERQAGDQEWGEEKGTMGLAKPEAVTKRGSSKEGVNEMVQRAAAWAEGLECPHSIKRGLDALQSHRAESWSSLPFGVFSGWGPFTGGVGRRLLNLFPKPGLRVWEGLQCQIADFGSWGSISPLKCPALFLQVWLETCLVLQLL